MPTRFILVRHGETLANREFRYIGLRDDALSEKGEVQASQLAEALAILPVAAVYSSPLQRAYQTALPIAARHKLAVQTIEELKEVSFGQWEGMSRQEVMVHSQDYARLLQVWEADPAAAPPEGESLEAARLRIEAVLARLANKHTEQTVVLVSHVGPIKLCLCLALGLPLLSTSRIFLDPATISVVDWQISSPVVRLVNSHAHLGWSQARWMHK
ncbi:histidine phosphatase family protein [Ktedonosporobacter rubrisoli]|uniref:Histidine phosphatase family protein n=1 Tax=Ktedonosporobacter rubrisoli TaxID=2509675 RepID=A0A4P6JZV0_KTERU|nr:histidine phosphatase family protein [Ktedonosporobacter rubrisoli]QBD81438.1 histidine phosphatase family protein [Ktedonosporobacter rubrisoli]